MKPFSQGGGRDRHVLFLTGFVNTHTRTHTLGLALVTPLVLFILSRCVVVLLILKNPVFVIKLKGTVVLFPLVSVNVLNH